MALQDLTPQLRTRLNRTEKAAGWFVGAALLLLVFGFSYYLYHTARNRGWFITKIQYQTGVNNAAGLKVKAPVKLMGFDAGEITRLVPNDPNAFYGVTVFFSIKDPNFGYIWSDSTVKVQADFLGNRYLEITKGRSGVPTVIQDTNNTVTGILKSKYVNQRLKELEAQQEELKKQNQEPKTTEVLMRELNAEARAKRNDYYNPPEGQPPYWLHPDETAALNDRLEKVARQVEQALPNVLALTNQLLVVLNNGAHLTSNLNDVAMSIRPAASNLAALTEQLKGPGALGEWVLGTNIVGNVDTNLAAMFDSFGASLENLSQITSNLNVQVQANTNLVGGLSKAIVDTDDLVQGLKRHWLFRSAFKKTNAPPANPPKK